MANIKENEKELARLYGEIANGIVKELPQGWTHLATGFFVDEDGCESQLIYVSENNGKDWRDFMKDVFAAGYVMKGVIESKEACQELHALCAKAGDKWTQFTLLVDAQGNFHSKYDYDSFERMTPMLRKMWIGEFLA